MPPILFPYVECESDELRLDVHNGLLLSALWDCAFDAGLISFADTGRGVALAFASPRSPAVHCSCMRSNGWGN